MLMMESLTVLFDRPDYEASDEGKEEGEGVTRMLHRLGISEAARLYLLPHTIMKYSIGRWLAAMQLWIMCVFRIVTLLFAEFDEIIVGILLRDPKAHILVLFAQTQRLWLEKLRVRLCHCIFARVSGAFLQCSRASYLVY